MGLVDHGQASCPGFLFEVSHQGPLNSLLYKYETDFAELIETQFAGDLPELGEQFRDAKFWRQRAAARKAAVTSGVSNGASEMTARRLTAGLSPQTSQGSVSESRRVFIGRIPPLLW